MIGWLRLSKGSPPTWAALHPTPGGAYASAKEHSPGFILTKLPFSDDIVEPDEQESAEPSESQQEAADAIVKKLTVNYRVDNFGDVEVRSRTNMIEALALDLDDVEPVEDDTDVDLDDIRERLGALSEAFNDCEHLGPEPTAGKGRGGRAAGPITADVMVDMIRQGLANKLNIAQLKELLKTEGVRNLSAMNKTMLVSVANKRFGGPMES